MPLRACSTPKSSFLFLHLHSPNMSFALSLATRPISACCFVRESEPHQRPVFVKRNDKPSRAVFPKHEATADDFEDMPNIDAQVRFYFQLSHGFSCAPVSSSVMLAATQQYPKMNRTPLRQESDPRQDGRPFCQTYARVTSYAMRNVMKRTAVAVLDITLIPYSANVNSLKMRN